MNTSRQHTVWKAAEAVDVTVDNTEGHVLEFTPLVDPVQQSTIDRVH